MRANNYLKILATDKTDSDLPKRRTQEFLFFFDGNDETSFQIAQNRAEHKAAKLKDDKYNVAISAWRHVAESNYPEIGVCPE